MPASVFSSCMVTVAGGQPNSWDRSMPFCAAAVARLQPFEDDVERFVVDGGRDGFRDVHSVECRVKLAEIDTGREL